ncbi:bifunctional 2-polyprenyl-6-hydroxyphenol methylase/3-demethylubiquinol 3-O-methyltransferase UbiG [Polynucleobacter sp. 80A-SIGWE]|uniref:class I SAM-dependent methyltransferase n=1 Tax=Polynucleobacter sp. 80A-SIGWE TaxID=2689100 RepID=UPI001C0DCE95|nr:class I SAM-dependent methyltransferase [Polynucleobacter sp. 80A-SIGWE]MBU3588900.1 class I SAM-dependent methyltransferase [Polynucleobacter sp. 80A-SIGWE]
MEQTPIHDFHNPDLLRMIPENAKKLIEVGCSSGALAREFKKISPNADYFGIEIDPDYADLARRFCSSVSVLNIESADADFWESNSDRDCWIFGDTLEHLQNPWLLLKRIYEVIPSGGTVVACIPNAQHWSIQAKLSIGDFRYEDRGLMDKTHLRWFTRQTIIEMFDQAGFVIEEGAPRIFDEPQRDSFLPAIGEMARLSGADPQLAISDSLAYQYVVKAVKN